MLDIRYASGIWLYAAIDPQPYGVIPAVSKKSANASGHRRALAQKDHPEEANIRNCAITQNLMAEYSATGLPPAYIPKEEGGHDE